MPPYFQVCSVPERVRGNKGCWGTLYISTMLQVCNRYQSFSFCRVPMLAPMGLGTSDTFPRKGAHQNHTRRSEEPAHRHRHLRAASKKQAHLIRLEDLVPDHAHSRERPITLLELSRHHHLLSYGRSSRGVSKLLRIIIGVRVRQGTPRICHGEAI